MTRALSRRDVVIIAGCIAIYAVAGLPVAGSMVDDTYIHMQYAKNLAEAGELSFNRGDPSYGATSPLWVLILALVHVAGGDMSIWCRLLSWAAGAFSIALIYLLVMRIDGRRLIASCAATMLACDAWLLRWSATGMESSMSLLAVLVCLYAALSAVHSAWRSALFGVLLLLAFLVRPEAGLLVPAALISFAFAERGETMGKRFAWLITFVPLIAVYLLLVRMHTGTFLPLTAGAKQGRPVFGMSMLTSALVPVKIIGATLFLPAVAAAALMFICVLKERRLPGQGAISRGGMLLLVLWVFLLPTVYVIFDFQVLSRYLLLVSPAIVAVGTMGFARIAQRAGKRAMNIVMILLAAVTITQSLVFYFSVVVSPTREFSRGLEEVLVPMGRYLAKNSPPGSIVASPDIGAIGYYSGREVLDLGGLVTPEINEMRRRIDVEKIIGEGLYLDLGADYLVDRHSEPMRFEGCVIRGVRFVPLRKGVVSNLGIRKPDPVTYVLYRLEQGGSGGDGRQIEREVR